MKLKDIIGSMASKFAALVLTFGLAGGAWGAAQIGDTPYATLAEAVAAVPTDGTMTTITMVDDEDTSSIVTIPEGAKITLVGGAEPGHQVGSIVNNGTLTLKGYITATEIANNNVASLAYITTTSPGYVSAERIVNRGALTQSSAYTTIRVTESIVNYGAITNSLTSGTSVIGNIINHETLVISGSGSKVAVNYTTIEGSIVNYGTLNVQKSTSSSSTAHITGKIYNYYQMIFRVATNKYPTFENGIVVGDNAVVTGLGAASKLADYTASITTLGGDSISPEIRESPVEYNWRTSTGELPSYLVQSPYGKYMTFKEAWDDVMAHNVGNSIDLLADVTLDEVLVDTFTRAGGVNLHLNGHTLTVNSNGGFSFANDWTISSMASTAGTIVIDGDGDNLADRFSIGENGKLTIVKDKVNAELDNDTSLLDVLTLVYASGYAITEDSTNIYVERASDVPAVVHVDSIALDKTEMTLAIGETNTLTATISPANATEQFVVWSAGDINIAGIETPVLAADIATIKVFGQSAGTAYISARPLDWGEENPENYVCCTVTVTRSSNFYQDANDEDILHIANLAGLQEFRNEVNAGNSFAGKTVVLDVDIDMSSIASWDPIGQDYETIQGGDKLERRFAGTFDGNNKTLSNLTINDNTHNEAGLFGVTGYGSTFKDLTLDSPTVNGRVGVGTLAGKLWASSVINCHVTGDITVTGYQCVGGLAGSDSYTVITGCSVIGADKATSVITGNYVAGIEDGDNIGGLVGMNGPSDPAAQKADQATSGCSVGNLTLRGWRKVGGLSGQSYNRESVYDCSVGDIDIICLADTTFAAAKEETLAFGGMVGIFAVVSDDTKYRHAENSYLEGTVSNVTITCANDDVNAYAKMGIISGGQRGSTSFVVPTDTQFNVTVSGTNSTSGTKVSDNTDKIYSAYKPPVAQIGDEKYETFAEVIEAAEEYKKEHGDYPVITVLDPTAELADLDWKIADGKLVHKNVIATLAQGGEIVGKYEDLHEALEAGKSAGSVVTLLTDVDLSGVNWVPVGTDANRFFGTFDGNGKTISNLTIDYTAVATSGTTYGGLIGGAQGATVRNVKLNNVVIKNGTNPSEQPTAGYGGRYGAVVGRLYGGTISNCTVTNVEIQDMGHNGGIVGATEANSTIENCKVQGTILIASGSNSGGGWDVGGILGKNNGGAVTIKDCTVDGTSAATSKIYSRFAVGGIVGYTVAATITDCTVKNVTVEGSSNAHNYADEKVRCGAGGIMGELKGEISGCTVDGVIVKYDDTTTTGAYAAVGLIGGACEAGVTINVSDCTVSESSAYWGETKVNHLDPGRRTSGTAMTVNYTNTAVGSITSNGITTYYVTAVDAIAAADREGVDEIAIIENKIVESPDNAWKVSGDKLVRKDAAVLVKYTDFWDNPFVIPYESLEEALENLPDMDEFAQNLTLTILKDVTLDTNVELQSLYSYQHLELENGSTEENISVTATGNGKISLPESLIVVVPDDVRISQDIFGVADYETENGYVLWTTEKDDCTEYYVDLPPAANTVVMKVVGEDAETGPWEAFWPATATSSEDTWESLVADIESAIDSEAEGRLVYQGTYVGAKAYMAYFEADSEDADPDDFVAAVNAAREGSTIVIAPLYTTEVNVDISASTTTITKPSGVKFDLNGYTLTTKTQLNVSSDFTASVAETCDSEAPTYTYATAYYVAQIVRDDAVFAQYASLAAAFSAAQSGDTVQLLADVDLGADGLVIESGKNFTLDIGEFNITGAVNGKLITNNGTLVVNGTTGCVYNTDVSAQGHDAILNNGTITINGGWFGDSDNDKTNANPYNRGTALRNYGVAVINGGHFTVVDNNWPITAYAYVINTYSGTLTVNNADVYGKGNGSFGLIGGTATIVTGTFSVDGEYSHYAIYNSGCNATVQGGTFTKVESSASQYLLYASGNGTTTISGGTFASPKTNFISVSGDTASVSISGGYFSSVVPATYCATGYLCTTETMENGYYQVVPAAKVTFALGEGAPGGAVAPEKLAYPSGNPAETALPMPTYASADKTFAGWKVKDSDPEVILSAIPAGATTDYELVATWTGVKKVVITESDKTADIKVTDAWIGQNVTIPEGATEEQTKTAIENALNAEDENGLKKWENYVLGLNGSDPNANVAADAAQGPVSATPITSNIEVPKVDTGFKVEYKLVSVDTNGTTVAEIDTQATPDLTADIASMTSETNVVYYKTVAVITSTTDSNVTVEVPSTNTIGVLKVASAPKTAMIAVPWAALDGDGDISAANLVRTANLTEGDELHYYKNGKFQSWTLGANGTWQSTQNVSDSGTTNGDAASGATIPRGSAVWLKRQDASKPVYLVGEVGTGTAKTALEGCTENGPAWNMVASPSVEGLDISAKFSSPNANDRIVVPTDGAPKNYFLRNGKWGYTETTVYEDGVETRFVEVGKNETLPAGTGFWYLNSGAAKEVDWTSGEEGGAEEEGD